MMSNVSLSEGKLLHDLKKQWEGNVNLALIFHKGMSLWGTPEIK